MTIAAIPTTYKFIRFRSRLEARWAAFFDRIGWKWKYEPLDLAGWIPDFIVYGKEKLFCEVKPIDEFDEVVAAKILRASVEERLKGDVELLLLGNGPFVIDVRRDQPLPGSSHSSLGWLAEVVDREVKPSVYVPTADVHWGGAVLLSDGHGTFGLCHSYSSYKDRIGDLYWKDSKPAKNEIACYWNEAGNETQWKGQ